MKNNSSAIIVGAGIGGISTAIFLSRNGYSVEVFEKTAYPGGRCGQIIKDGHRFDLGATILMMPSIYRNVFESLGLNFDECFELKKLQTIYKVYFRNEGFISFSTDKDEMKTQLEAIEAGSYNMFRKYISIGNFFFRLSFKDLLGRNFLYLSEFITFRNVILLIRLKAYLKHINFVKRFFKTSKLQQAFTFQNIYVGQSPLDAPALFSMLPATELTEGALFPTGGMYSITEKLVKTATDLGVKFHYGMTVAQIVTSGKKAESVLFSNGTILKADVIVANADLPYVYRELLPDKRVSKRLEVKEFACSALVFHWGLSKVYPQLNHHNIFLSDDYQKSLEMIFRNHSLSDNPSFYVHSPVRTDLSAAPAGEDTLSVIIPMGQLDSQNELNLNHLIKTTRTSVLNRLKEIGMDDIEENIKFEICYTPATWKNVFNVSRGSVFGSLKHSIMQMGYFRPHNRHNIYRNLYFVGGSTHPGNGVPLVLLSAKLTSERILMEQMNKKY